MISTMVVRNRNVAASNTRKDNEKLYEVDMEATKGGASKLNEEEARILNMMRNWIR